MMLRKLCYLASVGVAACLVQNASAWPSYDWTGNGDGSSWTDNNNWWCLDTTSALAPPNGGAGAWAVRIDPATTSTVNINNGDNINLANPIVTGGATVYGGEWGVTMNLNGNAQFNFGFNWCPVGDPVGTPSTINMYGTSATTGDTIALGYNWWWNWGPNATMNMYSSSTANIAWLWLGGHLNLYGNSVFTVSGGVNADVGNAPPATGEGFVTDATRWMNIAGVSPGLDEGGIPLGSYMVIPTTWAGLDGLTEVTNWISRDILRAYEGGGIVGIDTDFPGEIILYAETIPEPGTLALLGLGGFAYALYLRRRYV